MNVRLFRTLMGPGVMAAALCCLLSADAIGLPPHIQLDARVHTADDTVIKETIAPGAVLRSGDEVRIRVTARADGHLYVIALGSSGTAELLHPFVNAAGDSAQGGALPAPVGSGEVVAVPADGGYLPLDHRLGQEMIVAFVADQPIESLTRLMFRMEGLFDQPAAAREVLVSEGYELAHLSFSHAARAVAIATAPAATMPTLAPDLRKASADDVSTASVPAVRREEGVLGELGSRIAQLIGQPSKSVRDDPAAAPTAPAVVAGAQSLSDATPEDAAATQSGSLFSRWFGTDEKSADNDSAAVAAVPEPPKVQQARTFALPAQQQATQKELPPRSLSSVGLQSALEERPAQSATTRAASVLASRVPAIVAPVQAPATAAASSRVVKPLTPDTKPALEERSAPPPAAQVPAPRASTYVALEEDSALVVATGRMVNPLPVEATLYPAGKSPADPLVPPQAVESDVPVGGRVQRTLSRLIDDESAVDSNKVKPGVAAPEAVSGETPVIAGPALREEAEWAEEPAAKSNFGTDADSLREQTNRKSLMPLERGSESVADRQAVDVPADVVISRPADAAQQSGSWFSALGALFSTTKPNTPSDEEISGVAGASDERGQANAQNVAALGPDRTLIVQPVETLTTDAQLEAREPAATIAEQTSADQSEAVGESAVLSGLGRNLPAQTSPETDPVRSAGADAAREATTLSREQPEAAVAPSASQGGLLAGLSTLLGSSAVGDEDARTPQIQPASSTEQALAEEETVSVPLAEQPGVESNEAETSSLGSESSEARQVELVEPKALGDTSHSATIAQLDRRKVSTADGDSAQRVNAVTERASASAPATSADTGLLAGLGRLFRGSESSDSTDKVAAPLSAGDGDGSTQSSDGLEVADTQNAQGTESFENADSGRADVEAASEGGLLAGIGALLTNPFASSEPASSVAPELQAQAPAQTDSPDVANASAANTDDEPRIKRRVERDGKEVVVLDGVPAARSENKENLQVLGGAGSRIRRLLDEPEPKADGGLGPEVGKLGATPLDSTAGATTTPAQTTSFATQPSTSLSANAIEGPTEAQQSTSLTPLQQVASPTAAPARAAVPRIEVPLASVDVNGEGGVASSVVLVITPAGNTSGVVIDRNGHLLTNWHSVNRFDEVVVMFKQARGSRPRLNEPVRARVVAHSKFADLALLKVETVPAGVVPAVLVADVNMQSGAPIHAIGHAAGRGDNGQWRHDVASVDRVRRSSSWYSAQRVLHRADVIRAEMNPVHNVTGAPLFNNQLELVGLGAMVRVDKGEIVGVSAATIRVFLAAAG